MNSDKEKCLIIRCETAACLEKYEGLFSLRFNEEESLFQNGK